jgi:threonine/homoserine/homoserine lactone efflux protein
VFYLLSGALLIFIGLSSLVSKKRASQQKGTRRTFMKVSARHRALAAGIVLATANPIEIIFWITTIGRYLSNHNSSVQIAVNCAAIFLGSVVFYVLLLALIDVTHKRISPRYLAAMTDFFGAAILVYGGFILSRFV